MDANPVDEIKNRLDIVEIIGGYLKLQKAGRNYRAPCPFHSEKSPSFMVSPERQMWKCFGCDKGGSMFDFIMEIEGIDFGDALRMLAQRAGVELKKADGRFSNQIKTERNRLYEICQLASQFFCKQLQASQTGKKLKKYLTERGVNEKTIEEWRIGYAPEKWQSLVAFLKGRGYPEEEVVKAGLAVKSERRSGSYYDRFRDRIIFPIANINGIVVGFGGRENPYRADERMGKYINTPNTLIYDKSQLLYGLDKAKVPIRKNNACILVEGNLDVIMSHQSGSEHTVAVSGTALTYSQLRIIKRYTDNLLIAFDMDLAGENAAKKGIDLALEADLNTKIISLPQEQDPADCLKEGKETWQKAIAGAQEVVAFYLSSALARYDPETAEGKKVISKTVLPVIRKMPNRVEQAHWLQETACRLKTSEKILAEEMKKTNDFSSRSFSNNQSIANASSKLDLEEYTLGLVLTYPEAIKEYQKETSSLFSKKEIGEMFEAVKRISSSSPKKKSQRQSKLILSSPLKEKADEIMMKMETQNNFNKDFCPIKEAKFCFCQLKDRRLRQRLNELNLTIRQAEEREDKENLKKLTQEFYELSKQCS